MPFAGGRGSVLRAVIDIIDERLPWLFPGLGVLLVLWLAIRAVWLLLS